LEDKRRSIDLPWATIAAALAATGGLFLYLNPLETSRPTERAGFHSDLDRHQDVDARLWQDPLRTTSEHESQMQWYFKDIPEELVRENRHHSVDDLMEQLRFDKCWLLPVMIPGSSYAEYAETRLRMRQAVLEGLGAKGYVPEDGEHIGYVKIDKPEWGWHKMIVPYEWCKRDLHGTDRSNELPDRVCVMWLRDEEFGETPLFQLHCLFGKQGSVLQIDTSRIKTRIIGPRSSTTLRKMVAEVAGFTEPRPLLENIEMWCPTATASDELLLQGIPGAERSFADVEALFREKLTKTTGSQAFSFKRSTVTDKEVMRKLLDELREKRNVNLSPKPGSVAGKDQIVLISEWDTFFGRALPMSTRHEVLSTMTLNQLILRDDEPGNVRVFHYLRGIDGMLPGTVSAIEAKSKAAEQSKTSVARELTEGLNQSDYLRRLARELATLDKDFHLNGKNGIKAIGVLGSDVYDKLLILEALRRTFSDAVFFTNTLDARLAHPDEWRWTRNLLVASPFGLTLRSDRQKVPPFRDSNQTAVYTATLLAAGDEAATNFTKERLGPVRFYEIGRNGAFDLTSGVNANSLQPPSSDNKPWWNPWRRVWAMTIFLVIASAVVWILCVIAGRPESVAARNVWVSSWAIFVALAFISIACVWIISLYHRWDGEPYSWSDGISVWPTETFRLLVILLSIFYILRTSRAVSENEDKLESHFGLIHSHEDPDHRFSRDWWGKLFSQMSARHWKFEKNRNSVSAKDLWNCYADSGKERARWLRVIPLITFYVVAGLFLMFLLGWPPMPARGPWARGWNVTFFVLSMLGSITLTFYVADVTLLNRRLIHCLTTWETDWPKKAIENLRGRWSLNKTQSQEVPSIDLLVDYLKIDLIAQRTEVVGGLIYYPFVTISLFILSRAGIFDYWTWPLPILILVGFNAIYAAFSAAYLRRTAERARQHSLQRLNDRLIAYTADGGGKGKEARTIRETINLVRAEDRGAFAAISQHPLAGALILPTGSAGIWALLQYFPHLFAN
jgi:hypothetical protein